MCVPFVVNATGSMPLAVVLSSAEEVTLLGGAQPVPGGPVGSHGTCTFATSNKLIVGYAEWDCGTYAATQWASFTEAGVSRPVPGDPDGVHEYLSSKYPDGDSDFFRLTTGPFTGCFLSATVGFKGSKSETKPTATATTLAAVMDAAEQRLAS